MGYGINPIIYILIERSERELDSKLLTALFLIKQGFHVMLGQQWILSLNKDCLPTGTFFFKGMNKIHTDHMAKVRQFGHIVVANEEELLDFCMSPPEYYDFRETFSTDASRHCQLFLATSKFEMGIVKKIIPSLNVRLTGNPRTDCLRPELVSVYDRMRKEISETVCSSYVLIDTNFGVLNSRLSSKALSDMKRRVAPEDEEWWIKRYQKRKNAEIKWQTYDMKATFRLIELFGQYSPNQKVIIRPHPVESIDTYIRFSRKYPNVEVVSNQGSARPWILASDVLIHTGCTTGTEAVAMDHPTISIQRKDSELVQYRATNHVSYSAHTAEEAYQAVLDFYAGKLKLGDDAKLKEFWPAQEGKFAAERIADEIHQFYLDLGGSFGEFKLSFSGKFRNPKNFPDDIYKKMLVKSSEVEHILKQFSQQLPDAPNLELHEICTNVFYIRPT